MEGFIEVEEMPMYLINNIGNLYSKKTNKFLKWYKCKKGYLFTYIYLSGKKKKVSQHCIIYRFNNMDYKLFKGYSFGVIHHINSITDDNRIDNLILISNRENCSKERTIKSKLPVGVYFNKQKNKYQAQITLNNKCYFLGRFNTIDEAKNKYLNALDNWLKNNKIPFSIQNEKQKNVPKYISFSNLRQTYKVKVKVNNNIIYLGCDKNLDNAIKMQNDYLSKINEIKFVD